MEHIKNILKKLDLTDKEIDIYIANLKIGTTPSSGISHMVSYPQSTIKYTLESLTKKNLLTKSKKGITTYFTAEHPAKLKNLLIVKKNELENTEKSIDNIMGDLIGLYNPYTKIPKVTFYEGIDGFEKILNDSLTAKETIDSFANVDDLYGDAHSKNKIYTKKRIEKKINKRSIYSSTKKTEEYIKKIYSSKDSLNEIKYVDSEEYSLYISFMIYDGKISYCTYKNENYIGVIIENYDIYNFHKNMFKLIWKHI